MPFWWRARVFSRFSCVNSGKHRSSPELQIWSVDRYLHHRRIGFSLRSPNLEESSLDFFELWNRIRNFLGSLTSFSRRRRDEDSDLCCYRRQRRRNSSPGPAFHRRSCRVWIEKKNLSRQSHRRSWRSDVALGRRRPPSCSVVVRTTSCCWLPLAGDYFRKP